MSQEQGPLRVMVVDDEPIVCRRVRPVLEKLGFEVETFLDGRRALERFEEAAFDVVVADVRMPGLDGLALLRRIRDRSRDCKVILITGLPASDVGAEALGLGAFAFMAKPFTIDALRRMVERAAAFLRETRDGPGTAG